MEVFYIIVSLFYTLLVILFSIDNLNKAKRLRVLMSLLDCILKEKDLVEKQNELLVEQNRILQKMINHKL